MATEVISGDSAHKAHNTAIGQGSRDEQDLVSSLIDAAKRMQVRRLQRVIAEISKRKSLPALPIAPIRGLGSSLNSGKSMRKGTEHPSINGCDQNGRTALHFSCGMASEECATMLLQAGADMNARDKDGLSPLHMAAGYGRNHIIGLLTKHGANPFVKDNHGRSPRELALEVKDCAMRHDGSVVPRGDMDQTIAALANAEWKIHQATKERQQQQQQQAAGPSTVEERSLGVRGGSAFEELVAAAAAGELEATKKALEKLPWKDEVAWAARRATAFGNALSTACRHGHVEVAECLLKQGAAVDALDTEGATPLLAASDSGSANCVKLLLEAGAEADARDRVGVTALIAAAYNGHCAALKVLLERHASVDARSQGGVTALIAAAEGRHAECITQLLQAGADVDARTSEGKSALMHASGRNAADACLALLKGKANPNAADSDGCTSLHHSARTDALDCLKLLCEHGGDITRKCKRGRTALSEAPVGSESAKFLEEKWRSLEAEVEKRQEEILQIVMMEAKLMPSDATEASSLKKKAAKKKSQRRKKNAESLPPTPETDDAATNGAAASAVTEAAAAAAPAPAAVPAATAAVLPERSLRQMDVPCRPSMSPVSSVSTVDFFPSLESSSGATSTDGDGEAEARSSYDDEDIFEILAPKGRKSTWTGSSYVHFGTGMANAKSAAKVARTGVMTEDIGGGTKEENALPAKVQQKVGNQTAAVDAIAKPRGSLQNQKLTAARNGSGPPGLAATSPWKQPIVNGVGSNVDGNAGGTTPASAPSASPWIMAVKGTAPPPKPTGPSGILSAAAGGVIAISGMEGGKAAPDEEPGKRRLLIAESDVMGGCTCQGLQEKVRILERQLGELVSKTAMLERQSAADKARIRQLEDQLQQEKGRQSPEGLNDAAAGACSCQAADQVKNLQSSNSAQRQALSEMAATVAELRRQLALRDKEHVLALESLRDEYASALAATAAGWQAYSRSANPSFSGRTSGDHTHQGHQALKGFSVPTKPWLPLTKARPPPSLPRPKSTGLDQASMWDRSKTEWDPATAAAVAIATAAFFQSPRPSTTTSHIDACVGATNEVHAKGPSSWGLGSGNCLLTETIHELTNCSTSSSQSEVLPPRSDDGRRLYPTNWQRSVSQAPFYKPLQPRQNVSHLSFRKTDSVPDLRHFESQTHCDDSLVPSISIHEVHGTSPLPGFSRSKGLSKGMSRSASEGCLHVMVEGQDGLLPFARKLDGGEIGASAGWFSLVPSPI